MHLGKDEGFEKGQGNQYFCSVTFLRERRSGAVARTLHVSDRDMASEENISQTLRTA